MEKRRRYVPDLIKDMAECDANYIRIHRLFPNLDEEDFLEFGLDGGGHPLMVEGTTEDGAVVTMRIDERCPYTTMMTVRVTNEEDKPWVKWPTLEVRIYHDIKAAEVVSFERQRNFKFRYATPNEQMYQPDEKSQINRYFGELLTFCHEHGRSLVDVSLGDRT